MNNLSDSNEKIPQLKTMVSVLEKAVKDGYDQDFVVTEGILRTLKSGKGYYPHEVKVVNFYRFEGFSDPEENSILYIIEAEDGVKGTMVDAYGAYSNPEMNEFIRAVNDISKKEPSSANKDEAKP